MNPLERLREDRQAARELGDTGADISFLALAGPTVRTLVTRDVTDEGVTLFINKTSAKWKIIQSDPGAQVLIWLASLQRQYRISGRLEELDRDQVQANWPRRPAASKYMDLAYERFAPQSSVIEGQEALRDLLGGLRTDIPHESLTTPDNATGVLLRATTVECLDLNDEERIHDRRLYTRDGNGWSVQHLMP